MKGNFWQSWLSQHVLKVAPAFRHFFGPYRHFIDFSPLFSLYGIFGTFFFFLKNKMTKKYHVMCHTPQVTCHMSYVLCQMSHVTCHISPATCHWKKCIIIFDGCPENSCWGQGIPWTKREFHGFGLIIPITEGQDEIVMYCSQSLAHYGGCFWRGNSKLPGYKRAVRWKVHPHTTIVSYDNIMLLAILLFL